MKLFKYTILFLILAGCSSNAMYQTEGKSTRKTHSQYTTENADTEMRVERKGLSNYMVCSFYADKFHGRTTSNGEVFNMYALTCAHKTLPFNTKLRVTNEDNGKSVVVRVNDRGPFVKGRDLDLSYEAARQIGLIGAGVKELKVEILP